MSVRFNLEHRTSETFTIDDLRGRLGVPDSKLLLWGHLRSRAIDPAVAEISQLSRFIVTARPVKEGHTVVAVEFSWEEKQTIALNETRRELNGHSAGRKARRAGTVETLVNGGNADQHTLTVAAEFPATGSIHFGRWGELVRKHAPKPTPDVDRVAEAFRAWAASKGINLAVPSTEKRFVTFCESFRL